MDTFSKDKRSDIMSKVRGENTKPEVIVRKYLYAQGFRYRKNDKRYPGRPDIVLPKYRTVIFVNGCFWHQHPGCKAATIPKTNTEFWYSKLKKNVERDKKQLEELSSAGWRVIVLWECELSSKKSRDERLKHLVEDIRGYKDSDISSNTISTEGNNKNEL